MSECWVWQFTLVQIILDSHEEGEGRVNETKTKNFMLFRATLSQVLIFHIQLLLLVFHKT